MAAPRLPVRPAPDFQSQVRPSVTQPLKVPELVELRMWRKERLRLLSKDSGFVAVEDEELLCQ